MPTGQIVKLTDSTITVEWLHLLHGVQVRLWQYADVWAAGVAWDGQHLNDGAVHPTTAKAMAAKVAEAARIASEFNADDARVGATVAQVVEWLVAHGVERLEDQQAEPEQSNAHHPTL
jgi:hypothetical protein